jgi:hypothetical protein
VAVAVRLYKNGRRRPTCARLPYAGISTDFKKPLFLSHIFMGPHNTVHRARTEHTQSTTTELVQSGVRFFYSVSIFFLHRWFFFSLSSCVCVCVKCVPSYRVYVLTRPGHYDRWAAPPLTVRAGGHVLVVRTPVQSRTRDSTRF